MSEELNLDNPIFVIYINIEGLTRSKAEETINSLKKSFDYSNAKFLIIPQRANFENKIELLWHGSKYFHSFKKEEDLSEIKIKKAINNIFKLLENGTDDASLKAQIRNLNLDELIND